MLDTLVKHSQEGSFPPIEEIWSLDMINQGDAAHLNRDQLGDMCKLCNFLNIYFIEAKLLLLLPF